MRAGQLDRRITIERQTTDDTSGYGPQPGAWVAFASRISAQVQEALPSKSESTQQGLRIAARPARVRIRYLGACRT